LNKEIEIDKIDLSKIRIGGIEYNLEVALKRLKQDIRDDWFPDFLEFKDLFNEKNYFINQLKKHLN